MLYDIGWFLTEEEAMRMSEGEKTTLLITLLLPLPGIILAVFLLLLVRRGAKYLVPSLVERLDQIILQALLEGGKRDVLFPWYAF